MQNNQNLSQILLKPLAKLYSQKQMIYNVPNFKLILILYRLVSLNTKNFVWVQYCSYLVAVLN